MRVSSVSPEILSTVQRWLRIPHIMKSPVERPKMGEGKMVLINSTFKALHKMSILNIFIYPDMDDSLRADNLINSINHAASF